eukprot:349865-Prymnesium_polylepis.1
MEARLNKDLGGYAGTPGTARTLSVLQACAELSLWAQHHPCTTPRRGSRCMMAFTAFRGCYRDL